MKKLIDLPIKKLSYLKQVHLSFEMTGAHYEQLVTFNGKNSEQLILSILKDLIEEDVSKLTRAEAIYLFTLVKLNNLGPKVDVKSKCQACGKPMRLTFDISNGEVKNVPEEFEIPTIEMKVSEDGDFTKYKVMPPTFESEILFLDWYCDVYETTRDGVYEDQTKLKEFKLKESLLWLCLNDQRLFDNSDDFNKMGDFLKANSYKTCVELYSYIENMKTYGLQPSMQKCVCKECGGSNIFRLPLLCGFSE